MIRYFKEKKEKIDFELLAEELKRVDPSIQFRLQPEIKWLKFPYNQSHPDYPENPDEAWTEDAKFIVMAPENIDNEAILQVIKAHNPQKSSEEKDKENSIQKKELELQSSETIKSILQRLNALEAKK